MDVDIVDTGMFLRGCKEPLEQYRNCLMKNLVDWNGRGLQRNKLAALRIHQLAQMNIRRFDHQKLIMARIRELPDIPSMPSHGPREMDAAAVAAAVHLDPQPHEKQVSKCSSRDGNSSRETASDGSSQGRKGTRGKDEGRRRTLRHGTGLKGSRRGSIAGEKTWEAINKSLSEVNGGAKQRELGRIRRRKSLVGTQPPDTPDPMKRGDTGLESGGDGFVRQDTYNDRSGSAGKGVGEASGRRRSSLSIHNADPARQAKIEEAKAKRQRAIEYGNSALKTVTREGALKDLKKQILADFVDTIGCERATLMFVDTPAQELFFFDGASRISFPLRKGIAGNCAATGTGVIVNDPYSDHNFNPQIDKDTGFLTRNILCEPIKSRRGGNVVGVLQMVNKNDSEGFTEQDAAVMEMCTVKVANALDTTFSALVAAENEWAKTAGRRRSSDGAPLLNTAQAAAAAADAQAEVEAASTLARRGSSHRRRSSLLVGEDLNRRDSASGPQISNRRGSGASKVDLQKLKRRTHYGKEVRDSAVGLL